MKRIFIIIISIFLLNGYANAQSVGLVLSGGGAKGLTHIGVIKALEDNNIPIDYICGTSMGGIVGALYAIGISTDEMIYIFNTPEFEAWYKGLPEQEYASYFYKDNPNPKMFGFSFSRKKGDKSDSLYEKDLPLRKSRIYKDKERDKEKIKIDLPTSLVSPYSMDLAVMQIFTSAASACKYNFDSLMIPFFCVSSDIINKSPYISRSGDLGAAVRASMTYPFYFKPITIDSTLLFDGGFYNNFPWEFMEKIYKPDYIIGSKCVKGKMELDEEDLVAQITNMLTVKTNYDIPTDKGLVIDSWSNVGLMDFTKIQEIVDEGYKSALPHIDSLKNRIKRRREHNEIDSMRIAFRSKGKEVRFHKDIIISDNLNKSEKQFISRTIREDKREDFDFNQFKRGYYRIISSNLVKTFYPSYKQREDSLYTLKLKVTKAAPWNISIGGNISSSSLNQAYIGASYSHLSTNPWRVSTGVNIGKYYKGGLLKYRHDIGVNPLAYYDVELIAHQFDYYNGNQNLFIFDKKPNNIQLQEFFARVSLGTPISLKTNILAKFSFSGGIEHFQYYQVEDYSPKNDIPDKTYINFASPILSLERNTFNYLLYPSYGQKDWLSLRYTYCNETYKSGTTSPFATSYNNKSHNKITFKLYRESYHKVTKWMNIGILADLTISSRIELGDYIATMLYLPVFEPIPHSKTLLMENYRAHSYLGLGISPVFYLQNHYFCTLEYIISSLTRE
jgi:Predicted esterase of the alpha-beta hydrolase superfamily